jgi:hypothetical protein
VNSNTVGICSAIQIGVANQNGRHCNTNRLEESILIRCNLRYFPHGQILSLSVFSHYVKLSQSLKTDFHSVPTFRRIKMGWTLLGHIKFPSDETL